MSESNSSDDNLEARPSLLSRLGRTTVKGLASATIWHIGNQFVPLITVPYLARVLGVDGFGILAAGVAVIAYALLITDWGFSFSSMQAVARQRDNREVVNQIIWSTMLAKAGLASLTLLATLAVAWIAIGEPVLRAVILISAVTVISSVLNIEWALRGVSAFTSFAAAALIGRVATIPLVFLLIHGSADVPLAALVTVLGNLIATIAGWIMAFRIGLIRAPSASLGMAVRQIVEGAPMFLTTAAASIYGSAVMLGLALVSGTAQAGLYSGGDKLRRPVQGLLSPVIVVFFPQLNFLAESNLTLARRRVLQILQVQTVLAFVMAVLLAVLSPVVVPLVLGDEFAPAIPVLQVLCGVLFFGSIHAVLGSLIMLPFGMTRQFTACVFTGTLVGLVVLVPACLAAGAVGAAAAALAAEATVAITMFGVLLQSQPWFRPFSRWAR